MPRNAMSQKPLQKPSRRPTLASAVIALATVALLGLPTPSTLVTTVHADSGPHWVAVRPAGGGGTELYDTRTGALFRPRGVNLLHAVQTPAGATVDGIVAPGYYDQNWLDAQLRQIAGLGYNTIRVFMDLCPADCLTTPDPAPKPAWLDNLAALLASAKAYGLVVLLTSNVLPDAYVAQLPCCEPFHAGFNGQILSDEGLDWNRVYFRQIIEGLVERGAPLEAVLGWELRNETFFDTNLAPLSLTSGLVTTANGRTYDMADPNAKLEMVDDGLIFWADQLADTIKAIDPGALVTAGFFAPDEPYSVRPGDTRLVRTYRFIRESQLDFFDFHAYADLDLYLWQIAANFTLDATVTRPVLMGEFGSIRPAHPDARTAGAALANWMKASCPLGFDGWLSWAWGWSDPSMIMVTDDDLAIARALSPDLAPDPCNPPPSLPNLAFGQPVTVDGELPGEEGSRAVDGLALTNWNSGLPAPVTITIDLGGPMTIREVRLLVSQYPAGTTFQRVEVRGTSGGWVSLAKLSGYTESGQWLRVFPGSPMPGIRWIRIKTQKSPSWVAWGEIQVY